MVGSIGMEIWSLESGSVSRTECRVMRYFGRKANGGLDCAQNNQCRARVNARW